MDETPKPAAQRRPASIFFSPDSPVLLADLMPVERDRLIQTHIHGLPLDNLQHDMIESLRPFPRAFKAMSDRGHFDASDSTKHHPTRFLDQMAEVVHRLTLAGAAGAVKVLAARHNFHPEFAARIATYRPSDAGKDPGPAQAAEDARIVALQRRQSLPVFQQHMASMHGADYTAWLKENGFDIVASSPERIRETQVLMFRTAARREGVRSFLPKFRGSR